MLGMIQKYRQICGLCRILTYPVGAMMMFGMPAVALAMYHAAKPENRAKIGGMLASVAFTAFLTGITEPIEFMFMFLAPALYAVHAVLTGLSLALKWVLAAVVVLHGVRLDDHLAGPGLRHDDVGPLRRGVAGIVGEIGRAHV